MNMFIETKEEADVFLNELYELEQLGENNKLTSSQISRYVELVDLLKSNDIEIPFGITV